MIKVVFHLVIHSGISASCKHLFILIASLWWMEWNFLNSIYVPHQGLAFSNRYFLSVARSKLSFIFAFGPFSSSSNIFLCCLFIRIFCYDLSVPIFYSEIVFLSIYLVVSMFSCILPVFADRIFFICFRMSCFVCNVWSNLGIFLVFLLSLVHLIYRVLSRVFPRSYHFCYCRRLLIHVSSLISYIIIIVVIILFTSFSHNR